MTSDTVTETNKTHVTVCACTYRRPQGLKNMLSGLGAQTFIASSAPLITIIIADNEVSAENEKICQEFSQLTSILLNYVPVKERGISHARNACLDHIPDDADFIAMIDDDEIPEFTWLEQLLITQARTDGDVIYGPVLPVFTETAPQWIRAGHFFETPEQSEKLIDCQALTSAATGNCLLRASIVRQSHVRFDLDFALAGGEDKLFFRQLSAAGKHIFWAAHALVRETIPPERANFSYLFRSAFRKGNVKLSVKLKQPDNARSKYRKIRLFIKTFFKSINEILSGIADMFMALIKLKNRQLRLASGALRLANGLGIFASLLGIRYSHYR